MKRIIASREVTLGMLALVGLALFYATFGVFARALTAHLQIFQQIYLRIFAAFLWGLIIFPGAFGITVLKKIGRRDGTLILLRAFIFFILGVYSYTTAVTLTTLVNVSLISSLPLSSLWGAILFRERINLTRFSLITLSFFGAALVALRHGAGNIQFGVGEFWALIGQAAFTLGLVSRKWQSEKLNDFELSQLVLISGSVILYLWSIASGESAVPDVTLDTFKIVVLAGLMVTLNSFLGSYAFKRVEGVIAGGILSLESFFALLLGFLIYSEVPSLAAVIGGVLIILSAVALSLYAQSATAT